MASVSVQADKTEFTAVLRQRLHGFFEERHVSSKANAVMTVKIVVGLLAFAATYSVLYVFRLTPAQFVVLYVLHGLTQLFLLLNIAHDTNHNAISKHRQVNQVFSYIFDLCGINSYIWRYLHNIGHHSNVNICGEDEDIIARGYIRLSPNTPRKWRHNFQHFYAWFLYGFSTLDYVLVKDVEYFFYTRYRMLRRVKHSPSEYVALLIGKAVYFTYMLVLPVVVLHWPPLLVLGAFIAMHFAIGLLAQLVFQTAHALETSRFPLSKGEFDNYTYHILATTSDYSTRSALARFFLGGLNHHVVHHLCPSVCHTHYPELTRIVRETAQQYDVPYREHTTIWTALAEHYRLLKRLGGPRVPNEGIHG
jgi:linoleoyl-CoA desaturase